MYMELCIIMIIRKAYFTHPCTLLYKDVEMAMLKTIETRCRYGSTKFYILLPLRYPFTSCKSDDISPSSTRGHKKLFLGMLQS